MTIQRKKNEIIIKLQSTLRTEDLQDVVNFITYSEATRKSKAKQSDVNRLASEVNAAWWKKNAKRFVNEIGR